MDFFYDQQVKRYLLQFMRIFSDIKVRNGPDANGLYTVQKVPIIYGDPSWMVAQLIKGASENTMMPVPMFSAYIKDIRMSPDRRQDTQFISKVSTVEREYDPIAGSYGSGPGVRQDVERYMPVPYDLTINLDVWTSNVNNKLQLMEQICTIFNPSIQLQQNANILDWTSIFEVWMENIQWTNRSIPQGGEDEKDIMSFEFRVPIWINPPAKIKRSSLIAEVVTNIHYANDNLSEALDHIHEDDYDPLRNLTGIPTQIITTEGNLRVSVERGVSGDTIRLLPSQTGGVTPTWAELMLKYGTISPNLSKMRLKLDPNIESDALDVIGLISASQDPYLLNFSPDQSTIPPNTVGLIDGIVDPSEVAPGRGLPPAALGQRYIVISSQSQGEESVFPTDATLSPWGSVDRTTVTNDIIEYQSTGWVKVFNSVNYQGTPRASERSTGTQYTFEDGQWSYTYYGVYSPGYWRVDNLLGG